MTTKIELPWTEELVREHLPLVSVLIAGRAVTGEVVGRRLQFALVRWEGGSRWSAGSAEFSWKAIAHSLNTGTGLRV